MVNTMETFQLAYRRGHLRSRTFFMLCLLISGLLSFGVSASIANAATYYVDGVNGNDANPGTSNQPWETLSRAFYDHDNNGVEGYVQRGDTVLIYDGNYAGFEQNGYNTWDYYTGDLNEPFDSNYADWITYKAAPGNDNVNFDFIELLCHAGIQEVYYKFEDIRIPDGAPDHDSSRMYNIEFSGRGLWLKNVTSHGYEPNTAMYDPNYGSFNNWYNTWIEGASGVLIEDSNLCYGSGVLYISGNRITVSSCDISKSEADHIRVGSGCYMTIEDSNVYSWVYGSRPQLPGIDDANRAHGDLLQTTGQSSYLTIRRNVFRDHFSQGVWYSYTTGMVYNHHLWENNLFYNLGNYDITFTHCNDLVFRNNTLVGSGFYSALRQNQDPITNFSAYNNIIVTIWSDSYEYPFTRTSYHNYNIGIYQNNYKQTYQPIYYEPNSIYTSTTLAYRWSAFVNTAHSLFAGTLDYTFGAVQDHDPVLIWTNAVPSDFKLKAGSAAINFGTASQEYPTTDILGVSRSIPPDAGCYEYVSTSPSSSAPVLDPIGNKSVNENTLLTFIVSATDADSNTITYSATGLPSGATFAGQTFSWTPGYNQAGSYEVTFIASDGQAQDSETITITVNNVNRAPVLNAIGDKSANENNTLSFSVSASDADNDTIMYSAGSLPSGATLASQNFTWTPSYEQASTYQVTFVASDGQAQDSETITITVNNVNREPVLDTIGDKSANENSTLSFSVSASDADGDTITYSVESLPSGAAFVSHSFTWIPSYEQAGTYQVTFVASDSQIQDSETITITVNNANRAPVLSTIGNQSVYTGDSLTFTVDATDPDGDTVTYSVGGLPSGATFANQTFTWTPSDGQTGTYEVTFIASDGIDQDYESITITVSADTSAPSVNNCLPDANAIQVPTNSLVTLHIADSNKGVDANSVTIKVNNNTVYTGNTSDCSSEYGHCYRAGTKADYTFIYQANDMFDFDQTVTVTVNAADTTGNAMNEYSYSFQTEMRSFGENKKVNSESDNSSDGMPLTARDSNGDIWAAWHAGQTGNRDIYIGKLTTGADNFGSSVQLTSNAADQCNAAIAIDADNKLYVVWQDNRGGTWDIYISTSANGTTWSTERPVADANGNQTNPAIVIDGSSSKNIYVVWQDDQAGNQDIYVASSSNDFATKTVSQITSDSSDQTEPAIAANSDNTIYVVWTDARGGSNNIYGAASNSGPWTNVAIVNKANNQSSPAIAAEAAGSILHLLWVDDASGNRDIYYASSNGLPSSPLTGSTIIDDTSRADQLEPAIAVTGSTGNNLKVFACWQDKRNSDTDLYFVETGSGKKTNVLIDDDNTNVNQSEPAIGVDIYGHPYIVWVDSRNTSTDIYCAGSTFIESNALVSENVSASSEATVGTEPANISSVDDVSVIVPAGAYACDIEITISRIKNPSKFVLKRFSPPYEFGPSGIDFNQSVTITIPYEVSSSDNPTSAYWYNPLTGTLSQQGITDIEDIEISPTLHALCFKTTHLTQFFVGDSIAALIRGGGGGGCAISSDSQGNIAEFLLPYAGYIMVLIAIKYRDALRRTPYGGKQKAHNTARSER